MTTAFPPLISDLTRTAHLLSLVVGLGTAFFADGLYVFNAHRGLSRARFAILLRAHDLATLALAGLWLSGIALAYDLTRFEPERVTPKLVTKIGMVTLLTANALVIKEFALPAMARWRGLPFRAYPLRLRLALTASGVASATGWGTALLLGAAHSARAMDFSALFRLLAPVGAAAALGAFLLLWTPLPRLLARALPDAAPLPPQDDR